MTKTLKRKFIFASMLSATILIVLLVVLIALFGYIQMERSADTSLDRALSEIAPPEDDFAPGQEGGFDGNFRRDEMQRGKSPFFGYELNLDREELGSVFTASLDEAGEVIDLNMLRMPFLSEDDAKTLIAEALESGKTEGKLDAYKFRVAQTDSGSRIAFVDNTMQVRTLVQTVLGAVGVSAASLVVLFGIVLLVSGRVIRPIAENMDRQRQFVTNAGHEVKTPLAIIQANAETLEMLGGENKYLRNIKSQCARMSELMRQLLLLARSDEGAAALKPEALDLSAAVQADCDAFSEPAAQKGAKLDAQIEEKIMLTCDRDALEHILTILLDNATRYVNENGKIDVSLSSSGAKATLRVRNTVEKLPDAKPEMLFERFYRGDAARTQSKGGSGLGLSIAQSVAAMCRWKLKAEYGDNTVSFVVEF